MIDLFEKTLSRLVPKEKGGLFAAASYSLEGGKRLRPRLMLAILEAFSIDSAAGLYPACALEMVHTYSLIHDDLPCMDDDSIRRNKPALHIAYPQAHAILTGDFLLTYAFEVLSQAPRLSPEKKIQLIQTLSKRSGLEGMIGGQVEDMEDNDASLLDIYKKKTSCLFMASLECGAIIADAPDISIFQQIGIHLGLAFQLADDLKDQDGIVQSQGAEEGQKLAMTHYDYALQWIDRLPNKTVALKQLAHEMVFEIIIRDKQKGVT